MRIVHGNSSTVSFQLRLHFLYKAQLLAEPRKTTTDTNKVLCATALIIQQTATPFEMQLYHDYVIPKNLAIN